MERRRKLT